MPSFKDMLTGPAYASDDAKRTAANAQYMKQARKDQIADQQKSMGETGWAEARNEAAKDQNGKRTKIPSYRKGGIVRRTGLARLHKGEKVIAVKRTGKRSPRKRG